MPIPTFQRVHALILAGLAGSCVSAATAPAQAAMRGSTLSPAARPALSGRAAADTTGRGNISGLVTDSATGTPVASVDVTVLQDQQTIARVFTDRLGRYHVHNIPSGRYVVEARMIGFRPALDTADVGAGSDIEADLKLQNAPVEMSALEFTATPIVVDTRTGDQVFRQDQVQASPTLTTSQIVQQAVAGAVRAPTGEVHIRGQHAEYSYYVDGVPVPAGISGSLNELFDATIANGITFQTGSWDAEFGGKNAAIINVTTRVPTGGFHASASGFGGNYATNGQSVTASGNSGRFALFFSGSRTSTDLRREPVVADTDAAGHITGVRNYANNGEDLYGFAKVQYSPTDHDVVNLDVNWSRTSVQTPFDSSAGVIDDHERDINGFANLGWQHRVTSGRTMGSEAFAGAFFRHGSLNYDPGLQDDPSFTFAPDTTLYNIREARTFDLYGVKLDYLLRLSEELSFKVGTLSSIVRGHENFQSFDVNQVAGPASNSALDGTDFGVYAQAQIAPVEQWELRLGVRYDLHRYPVTAAQDTSVSQISPRIRLSFFPSPATSIWAYYGRQFVPTNTEDLRNITSASQGGVTSAPTLPERDHFFELGLTHRFPAGVVAKFAAYHKRSSPGVDDTQVPGTAITTNVNIDQVRVTGIEGVLEVRPPGPLSGFLNVAINHAYGFGAVTGGFFTAAPPAQTFDLDHDQRLSAVAGLTYGVRGLLATLTGIYGSGLTNGITPNTPGRPLYDPSQPSTGPLGTGLFDFNKEFKVAPNFVLNASAGYQFVAGGLTLHPQLFVDNVFDSKYSLKGTFFSGANFGRPRTFRLRMSVSI